MTRAPWSPATPGAPITASGWSNLQVGFRDALAAHRHTGGADGPRLRGEDLDPSSTLRVQSLDLSEGATVGGRDLGEWMADAERAAFEALKPEIATKLPVTGGRISGDLGVGGALTAGKDVKVGGRLVVGGKEVVPRVGVMSSWDFRGQDMTVVLPRAAHLYCVYPRGDVIHEIRPPTVTLRSGERCWTLQGNTFFDAAVGGDTIKPVPAGTWLLQLDTEGGSRTVSLVVFALWV